MRGRVRQPRRQAPERPRRPAEEGEARRGVDLARDARDPPGAARGRRQLHRRPRLRRPGAREGARRRGPEEPDARPAGREGRPRRAHAADGRGRVRARVRQVHRDPARRPPGLGQDDDRREARAPPAQAGPQARARSPPTCSARPRSTSSSSSARRSRSRCSGPTPRTRSRRRAAASPARATRASTP